MIIHELFDKYRNLNAKDIMLTVGQCEISTDQKLNLINLIECHQKNVIDDMFEKSIALIANQTINNLNEDEWVGRTIGKHTITSVINSGASGVVFLAEKGGDYVQNAAIKLINPPITKMIGEQNVLNEAQLLASLNHIGIAKIYDSGRLEGGIIYFVMEYIDGRRLSEVIDDNLTLDKIIELAIKICSAIAHSHESQIIHKDIKPDNILIETNGEIKLIDFGLSEASRNSTIVQESFFALTTEYASPEQISKQKLTSRTDIFSIGCILFELITREKYIDIYSSKPHPLDTRNNKGTIIDFINNKPRTLRPLLISTRMKAISAIIEKAVEPNPIDRYKTVDALSHDIERVMHSFPVKAYKPKSILLYQLCMFSKRNPLVVVMGMFICTSFIWFAISTQNQFVELQKEQENVVQVLDRIKDVLVHADPRERLGNPISFEDVLVRELNNLEISSKSNMSSPVRYELLMTIGEGLLGHGKGLEAEKAFNLAVTIAFSVFGDDSIEVVAAKVKLIQANTLNIYYEEIIDIVVPYFDHIFVEEFEHIEYARLFIAFNKTNSRFFNDNYKGLRVEPAIQTLKKISIKYKDQLNAIEIIDLDLTILKNTFYTLVGDYASPTAHVTESEVVNVRIPIIKAIIPDLDNLIQIARQNNNTKFLLPELLGWRARLAYETKSYQLVDVFFNESLSLAINYFEKPDFRLAATYLIGAAIYRFIDPQRALDYARKSFEIEFSSLNESPLEYLDNMTMLMDFLAMNGDFIGVKREIKKGLQIGRTIGLDNLTVENIESLYIILNSYLVYVHSTTHYISNDKVMELTELYATCNSIRNKTLCDIISYLNSDIVNQNTLTSKIDLLLKTPIGDDLSDLGMIYQIIIFLQGLNLVELSSVYIPLIEKNIDWSHLEKTKSVEYLAYRTFIGSTYLKVGNIKEAKKSYLHSLSILNEHFYESNAYVSVIYTGLAEIAFIENNYVKTQEYINKTKLSFEMHFNETTPLFTRMKILKEKLQDANK